MATPLLKIVLSDDWVDISGAAGGVAGVTWQNISDNDGVLAFTTNKPTSADGFVVLQPSEGFYDKNGSSKIWAMNRVLGRPSILVATGD